MAMVGNDQGQFSIQRTIEEAFLALLTRAVAIMTWVLVVTHVFIVIEVKFTEFSSDRLALGARSPGSAVAQRFLYLFPKGIGRPGLEFHPSTDSARYHAMWSGRYVASADVNVVVPCLQRSRRAKFARKFANSAVESAHVAPLHA